MIAAKVLINGIEVNLRGEPALGRNVKEEMDSGTIIIESTRERRYEMYDKVDAITPYNETEQYLVQGDNPVQLNATDYSHTITLFENIAFFNTIYPADRSFKVIGQTIGQALIVYERELNEYHNVYITWDTIPQEVLDEVFPFKEFAGLNLSTILLSLFRKIWAVPKVNRVGNKWNIYPLYHNNRNNLIPKESASKMSQQNNIDYATKVKSQLKNTVNERIVGEVSWFPSKDGYVLPKTSTLIDSTSNLRYELDSNIIKILGGVAVGIDYVAFNSDTVEYDTLLLDVDLTDRIIQNDIWDTKDIITSTDANIIKLTDNIKNYIRYSPQKPYITDLYKSDTDNIIFKSATQYLKWAIIREVEKNITKYFTSNYLNPATAQPEFQEGTWDIGKVKMRFQYIKQRNIDLVMHRKTTGSMNEITTIHQQRDASVETNEYKKNLNLYANRMGNNEYSKTKTFPYPAVPYKLFDYTDDKTIVTKYRNTYHNTFVVCEYEESENFSNIEAEYALMRRADPYTITSKAVTTNLVVQEEMEISFFYKELNTRLTAEARRLLGGLFEDILVPHEKVAMGVFKPVLASWNSLRAIHMPVEASGDADLITIHVQFPHQSIAAKTYYDLEAGAMNDHLNPLPYTDENGNLVDFQLYFTPDVLYEDEGEYPLILDETDYLANTYTTPDMDEPIDLDSAASFALTRQVSMKADETIYIGNSLSRDNPLVKDQELNALVFWKSDKPYGQYDQVPRSYDVEDTSNIAFTYTHGTRTMIITPGLTVNYLSVVRDGKILYAINKELIGGTTYYLYLNFVKDTLKVIVELSIEAVASVNMTYIKKLNVAVDLSINANASTDMTYEQTLYVKAYPSVNANADVSVTFDRILNVAAYPSVGATADVNVTYSQILHVAVYPNVEATADVSVTYEQILYINVYPNVEATAVIDMTYDTLLYQWVEVAEAIPTTNECNSVDDIGNIKVESVLTCAYYDVATYVDQVDHTSSAPACSVTPEPTTYTLCVRISGGYSCTDYEASEDYLDTYYECQLN
jgi:hypothetical protein